MTEEESDELKRQSLLLESLSTNEAFRIWRQDICEPTLNQIDALLAGSDDLPEAVVRANVKLRYLVKDIFYDVFERIRVVNDQDRSELNQ